MPRIAVNWKARYTITIGSSDKRAHDIDIDDPTNEEILSSPFYKGDRENARRYIVRRKADETITRFCNHLAVETESPTSFALNSLDFMENGVRKFSQRETSISMSAQIGAPISKDDFLALEMRVSTSSNDLLDLYADLYNRFLKSNDVFEKYKLLYLIANKKAFRNITLRTIRNMLHHTALDPKYADKCREADRLFGNGVRTIDLSNPDHQRKVQENLPALRQIAQSVLSELK